MPPFLKSVIVNLNNSDEYNRSQINQLKKQLKKNYKEFPKAIGAELCFVTLVKDTDCHEEWELFEYRIETDISPVDIEFYSSSDLVNSEWIEYRNGVKRLNQIIKDT